MAAARAQIPGTASGGRVIPLAALDGWRWAEDGLWGPDGAPFDIVLRHVSAPDREVAAWDQPFIRVRQPQTVDLICQERDGDLRFLVRLGAEMGLVPHPEVHPSLVRGRPWPLVPPVPQTHAAALAEAADGATVLLAADQSEKGGRFLDSVVRHRILHLDRSAAVPEDPTLRWLNVRALAAAMPVASYEVRVCAALLLSLL